MLPSLLSLTVYAVICSTSIIEILQCMRPRRACSKWSDSSLSEDPSAACSERSSPHHILRVDPGPGVSELSITTKPGQQITHASVSTNTNHTTVAASRCEWLPLHSSRNSFMVSSRVKWNYSRLGVGISALRQGLSIYSRGVSHSHRRSILLQW